MLRFLFLFLLLPTLLFSSKQTIFLKSDNKNYIEILKKLTFLSDDFVFTNKEDEARFLINTQFQKRYIENTILDKSTDKKSIVRTSFFKFGKPTEVLNKNTEKIFHFLNFEHDMNWIDDYYFTFKGSKIQVHKIGLNNIKELELDGDITQVMSVNGGKKLFVATLDGGKSRILLINTVTGTLNVIKEQHNSFLTIMDYNKNDNKLLFLELKKGKRYFFETRPNYNITTSLPISQLDRDIIQIKYYNNKILTLFRSAVSSHIRLYDIKEANINVYDDILVGDIVQFDINKSTIIYKNNNNSLYIYHIKTREKSLEIAKDVFDFIVLSDNFILIEKDNGEKEIHNLNNKKSIQINIGE